MKRYAWIILILFTSPTFAQQQKESDNQKQLLFFQDSLKRLGKEMINGDVDVERKGANWTFIRTLVSALKIPDSYHFPFDSLKSISLLKSPDDKFRIFTWNVVNDDGSYRFYGAVQLNSPTLKLFPFEDYSPMLTNPEDSVTDNLKWYGAQYYAIVPVLNTANPYYVLLGWKGSTAVSNKKVIDVISFKGDQVLFGAPVFDDKGKYRKRVVFQYSRESSMLLHYISSQHLIVFDNLVPPDKKSKDHPETYGPDLSYNGYRLKNGKWEYVDNLDMRNIPSEQDAEYNDPKLIKDEENPVKARKPVKKTP